MVAARAPAADHDHIVVLRGAAWSDYQRVMELRGDKSAPRIAFLEGDLEILRPSSSHENIKSLIGRLVEVYCLEHDLEFRALGAWTLEDQRRHQGVPRRPHRPQALRGIAPPRPRDVAGRVRSGPAGRATRPGSTPSPSVILV